MTAHTKREAMALPFSARDALLWTGGELRRGSVNTSFRGVSIDTRNLAEGELFIAIRGPQHDAHAFLKRALAAGAAGLLVETGVVLPTTPAEVAVLAVPDTTRALGELAAGHRANFNGPVVAITGSNGKTTSKEMCAAILSQRAPCLRNAGNLNNQFGLPLTLLRRSAEDRAVVVEIGMNHRGEIAPLAAIAAPTVGVITNVGMAHIEHLGSQEAIAQEKGDLIAVLPASGTAVLNADDPWVLSQRPRTRAQILCFGHARKADVRAENVVSLGTRGFAFELCTPQGRAGVHMAGLSETAIANALAATAAALAAGASLEHACAGLAAHQPVGGRMEQVRLPRNIILIDDTYNANPQSVAVALRCLAELKGNSRGIAILGDMGELGPAAEAAHRAAGELAAQLKLDFLFALGEYAGAVSEGAVAAGMDPDRVCVGENHGEVSERVQKLLQGNDWVLVKGSRSMHMERVVQALRTNGSS